MSPTRAKSKSPGPSMRKPMSRTPPEANPVRDPAHAVAGKLQFQKAFGRYSALEKVRFVLHFLILMVWVVLPLKVWSLFGWFKNEEDFTEVEPGRIYVLTYTMRTHTSCTIVIKSNTTGALYVRSPSPLTPTLMQNVCKLGKVAAIEATIAHDTFTGVWKEAFPQAVVLCGAEDRDLISDRVTPDATMEESADWLKNEFGIGQIIETRPVYADYSDHFLIIDRASAVQNASTRGKAVIMPCGFEHANVSLWSPITWMYMPLTHRPIGLGVTHALIFCRNLFGVSQTLQKIANMGDNTMLVFHHGNVPAWSGTRDETKKALMTCSEKVLASRDLTAFGF